VSRAGVVATTGLAAAAVTVCGDDNDLANNEPDVIRSISTT
jgi:hypothetical protein